MDTMDDLDEQIIISELEECIKLAKARNRPELEVWLKRVTHSTARARDRSLQRQDKADDEGAKT